MDKRYITLILILFGTQTLFPQGATFITLGDLSGGSYYSKAYGVSDDGKTIVGESNGAQNTYRGFVWKEGQAMIDLGGFPGLDQESKLFGVAANGMTAAGEGDGDVGGDSALVWTQAGGIQGLLLTNEGTSSASAISANGSVVVGTARAIGGTSQPFRRTSGNMVLLGTLIGSDGYGGAAAVSADGNVIAGWCDDTGGVTRAFRWESGNMTALGELSPGGWSYAYGISNDGSFIIGKAHDGTNFKAFRWTATDGMVSLGFNGDPYAISDDGKKIVGRSDDGLGAFLWIEGEGVRSLEEILETDHGIDMSDYTLNNARDISADGKYIVGYGSSPQSTVEAWRVSLPDIAINAPRTAERWVVGKKDSVRWNGPNTMFYNVDLSLDDGATWEYIDGTIFPGDTMITYIVPDSIRTTDQARVRVSNLLDSTIYSISPRFTIKGYDLTRVMPDGALQNYDIAKHSWQMGNFRTNLWPMSWWEQYDYRNGDDPVTMERYPIDWNYAPMNANPANFPAWPRFVKAFSEDQAYWSVFFARYKESAEEYWRSKKQVWRGSCFGMAYTSILAFNHPTQFLADNPGISQADSIHALFMNNTIRKAMNREFAKQYAGEVLANDVIGKPKSPRTLLQEAKDLFLDETKDGRPLTFFNNNSSGAHTVLPYRLARDATQSNIWRLYVYDNSNPNQLNRFIYIDSTANTWTDSIFNTWGTGSSRCYLELPSGNFLQPLTMGPLETLESEPMLQLYTGVDNEVLITNSLGETIGYQDSSDFNNLNNGIAIIPKTGSFSPPIGYYLPLDPHTITLSEFDSTEAAFSAIYGDFIYRYSRSDADFSQQDDLEIFNGLLVSNADAATKGITLTAVATQDTAERKITTSQLAVSTGDSVNIALLSHDHLQLSNFGDAKTYQLQISTASANQAMTFNNNSVSLPANSTHLMAPDWNDLSRPVKVYIDLNNDGTYDDSTEVANQPVSVEEDPVITALPEQFELLQNYPNPFNPTTNIGFRIPPGGRSDVGMVNLEVYDITGRLVKTLVNENRAPGNYSVQWDGTNQFGQQVGSGVYFYRLQAGAFQQVKKMLLMK